MFTLLFVILVGIGIFFLYQRKDNGSAAWTVLGLSVILLTVLLFRFLDFWGEKLWFDGLGYNDRFWTLFFAQTGFVLAGALIGLGMLSLLLRGLPSTKLVLKRFGLAAGAVLGGGWGYANWSVFLQFWHKVSTGLTDPILGNDAGFYLFSLPFLDQIYSVLLTLTIVSIGISVIARFNLEQDGRNLRLERSTTIDEQLSNKLLYTNAGVLLLVLAGGKYLERFHLLYSDLGAVSGPGWTDVNIVLPALWVTIAITALAGLLLFFPGTRQAIKRILYRFQVRNAGSPLYVVGSMGALVALTWILVLNIVPSTFQNFQVEPNEISYEKPYIENNIKFTNQGFNLHTIESQEYPVKDTFTRQMVQDNPTIFNNIRLWDWRALDAVLKQFQEIRLYYEFDDVDVDRYEYDGQYRQVMISAREMRADNLPEASQTFVNKVFKYTHGYGITLATVSDFTPEGLPNLLVKNIPPESEYAALEVAEPRIYYGELTDEYVIVNSVEPEFDYPRGDQNEYTSYNGDGGVQLSNFWRRLLYAYKMGDIKLLLSSYPVTDSRIMFRRRITERVRKLAPFLHLDNDPYIVNADGQLYWMIDAYTSSSYFPYSEPYDNVERIQYKEGQQQTTLQVRHRADFAGKNYLRNSVKVVVNAFSGEVDFYTFDEDDPIIKVWSQVFTGMMKPRSAMPEALLNHIRYPVDYLLTQGLMYAKYHMEDPEVFYNQEDLWIRATEKYYGDVEPVQPYYIMWEPPASQQAEFSLILPFTPKNRQVSIGWIAGLCEPENYGRFLAYSFPKEKRVLGPQQVETKIDQNSFLSGQLSLWDQRGSRVIRGNVLAIPVEETIIYIEPIYLQSETAAYPELRLVCIMHNDNLSYAETFEEALEGIFSEKPDREAGATGTQGAPPSVETQIRRAQSAFERYQQATGQGQFEEAAKAMEELKTALQRLSVEEQ